VDSWFAAGGVIRGTDVVFERLSGLTLE